jgi:Zn ribbon nucleic-acid-binding protein
MEEEEMKKALLAALALPFIAGFSAPAAHAADTVIMDRDANVVVRDGRSTRYRVRRAPAVTSAGPVVYGWSFRPLDCGVYHYWNGTKCVDSRVVPPDIGPK